MLPSSQGTLPRSGRVSHRSAAGTDGDWFDLPAAVRLLSLRCAAQPLFQLYVRFTISTTTTNTTPTPSLSITPSPTFDTPAPWS